MATDLSTDSDGWDVASDQEATCSADEHCGGAAAIDASACERAASIFRALGDPQRLRILVVLEASERCVSELCDVLGDNMPAISQRLRLLKSERIVRSRRDGKHIYYALADSHISRLVTNGLLHALEQPTVNSPTFNAPSVNAPSVNAPSAALSAGDTAW